MTHAVASGRCGAVVRRSWRSNSIAYFWFGSKTYLSLPRYLRVKIASRKERWDEYQHAIKPTSSLPALAILASVGAVHFWNKNEMTTKAESSKCLHCNVDSHNERSNASSATSIFHSQSPEEPHMARGGMGSPSQHDHSHNESANTSFGTTTMCNQSLERLLMARRVTGTPSQYVHCSHCESEETNHTTDIGDDDGDDEDPKDIPHYVDRMHAATLGGALDHRVALNDEAKYLLLSEDVYPIEKAQLTFAPRVPPPIQRHHPAKVVANIVCKNKKITISPGTKFEFWPYGFHDERTGKVKLGVPGPIIRARQGDVLQVNFTNHDDTGMAHSIDFHAVHG
jgi:hypothetical protein